MNTNALKDLIEAVEEYLSHTCDMEGECSIEHALTNGHRYPCSQRRKLHTSIIKAHEHMS